MLPDKQSLDGGIGPVRAFYIPWQLYLNWQNCEAIRASQEKAKSTTTMMPKFTPDRV